MKKLFSVPLLLLFAAVAFGQPTVVPTCNSFDASGTVPIFSSSVPPDTNGTPNCTDYFGVGNWANSPLPAGTITGYTLVAGGSGYSSTVFVVVTDPTGVTFDFQLAATDITGGVVTSITGGTGGANYTMPKVTIVDVGTGGTLAAPICGATCGSGAMATAVIGAPFTAGTGMLKFQAADTLPAAPAGTTLAGGLTLAVPDTTTFTNADYYEIGLVQYTRKFHSSLPPTTIRGYVQFKSGSTGCSATNYLSPPSYLGPSIVATKDKPVRVKFTNCLPTTANGGNLFIPTDTTYMGAGQSPNPTINYTENRATLHLHGGATPWISDGTPHQWTVPVGETAPLQTGASVAYVPDMWFDATTGALVPNSPTCTQGTPVCTTTNATNNPGQGSLSFYYTNQQGARLMFYHDHAYGITRLNVYAGEAAGYVLADPVEENALAAATAPGTLGAAPDLAHLIPLVIQDKTFVSSAAQIGAQDPTWAANFGTTPGAANPGDLWFPHVYIPNQNPSDPIGGANGFGHWDYGPWFFPTMTSLTAANPHTAVTVPCTSAAFPGQNLAPTTACPTCGCPITPNVSGTPEGFMDTPLVNGVAYPVLHVAPAAYRFKILSVGNDRSLNLSWFIADPTQGLTEVAMLAAAPPVTGACGGVGQPPCLCTAINPVAVPQLGLGQVSALLDNIGNPMNGTGLPLNCWPNYGPLAGIPAPQTMWAADGRAGGAPDPRRAGPPWIQIGSEGGLLPTPAVIPATPVNYEQNTRSITITNVAMHGLWLGPAERADVIVDFSNVQAQCTALGVSPCTLILYNDAPTPAPAFDSRQDYFTGDGDQTPIGGAPNTPAGYGPNTRTIMQVIVDQTNPNGVPFSLTSLKNAFKTTTTPPTPPNGLFATTQPTTIVPEPAYNSAYNQAFPANYMPIAANNLSFAPIPSILPLTFDNGQTPCTVAPCNPILDQKTIQELFTLDYGRMNATLGTEIPTTNFTNQTTIPLGYVDWPTELIQQGETQLWKITHNGVDTHFIHFHLFNVQVVNRVGWDGSLRQIDPNETGWKDTVRMNPLEDILVALQPITPTFPFPLPDSIRSMDVTMPTGQSDPNISGLDPNGGAAVTTVNNPVNFGWEYVWHCHILGHEENDMMRSIIFEVPPPAPSNLVAIFSPACPTPGSGVDLSWTDNSASETSFTVQRAAITDPTFTAPTPMSGIPASKPNTAYGGTMTFNDASATCGTNYFYRVQAVDDLQLAGSNPNPVPFKQAVLNSGWSPTVAITTTMITPTTTFTGAPASAAYNTSFVVTATTNASKMPTISYTGLLPAVCTVGPVTGTPLSATATVTMVSGAGTCALTASWANDATFFSASLTQSTNATLATPTVSFTGAPATAPYLGTFPVTATTNAGVPPTITAAVGSVCTVGSVSLPGFPSATALITMTSGTGTCDLTAAWPAPLTPTYSAIGLTQSTTATKIAPMVTFTGAPASAVYNTSFPVTATTNATTMPTISGTAGVCTVSTPGGTPASTSATVTMISGTGTCTLTANWATDANYLAAGPVTQSTAAAKAGSTTAVVSHLPNPSMAGQSVTVGFSVTGVTPPTGNVSVTATTGESCVGSLSGGTGSCTLTFLFSGNRTMTASYGGDANFKASSSSASTNHAVWDFAMGTNPGAQTVNGGQKATYTLTVSSLGGFTGPVALTCSVPAAYTCTVTPNSVTPNGGSKNATVTVNTVKGFPGTYTLTFTGTTSPTGFAVTHSVSPSLTVTK